MAQTENNNVYTVQFIPKINKSNKLQENSQQVRAVVAITCLNIFIKFNFILFVNEFCLFFYWYLLKWVVNK